VLFDAHFHVIDPRFPLVPNRGFVPEPFTVADYRRSTAHLGVTGGAVVSGSFQAYDQTYLLDALTQLGEGFYGVANIPPGISDEEVLALAGAGVRAWRLNLVRGGDAAQLALAPRLRELAGWHLEVYVDGDDLPDLDLPDDVVLDHLALSNLPAVLRLVERGARVKASGFARTRHDVPRALRAIASVNPAALLFGTDLPGTRAPRPFTDADLELVRECAGERALYDNARAVYASASRT